MKVLHVLDHSLPNYDGYAFRSREIVRCQREHGLETVQLTSPKHVGQRHGSETIEGVEYYRTPPATGLYSLPVIDQYGVVVALTQRLRELVAAHRPNLIHAHSPSLNGLAALKVARSAQLPLVYEVRSFWEDAAVDAGSCREGDVRYRLTRASETRVVLQADHVVPICRGIADDLKHRGLAEDRLTVVTNAVDYARFDRALPYDTRRAAELGLTRGKTLGFAGSFFTFEGLETLIDAMAAVRARDAAVRLLLIGDGRERADLEARARHAGVDDVVVFTGRVPHAEIEAWYGIVDVLVYPRRALRLTELVTPLKPLEAMAYGKPVIASDVGGHRELIDDDASGLLFRAGDAGALAAAAVRLLADGALQARLAARAKRHVETQHNWAVNVKRYLELYERLLRAPA